MKPRERQQTQLDFIQRGSRSQIAGLHLLHTLVSGSFIGEQTLKRGAFDSSIFLILRGEIPRSIGSCPETESTILSLRIPSLRIDRVGTGTNNKIANAEQSTNNQQTVKLNEQ